ncbi:MAG: protein-disulfide reductase DsbD N-terminal domain-containing protein [Pyrinomonadaceae bacterium]
MKKFLFIGLFLALALMAVGEARAQSISGSIGKGSVTRGGTTRANIVMDIPAGLHVNSRYPNSKYAIPTTVEVSASGVTLGGVSYPRGKNRKFSFSDETINIYEGRVVFGFNVTVPKGFRGRTVQVRAKVRYQACTDEVCYAPKTKEITLTARVR